MLARFGVLILVERLSRLFLITYDSSDFNVTSSIFGREFLVLDTFPFLGIDSASEFDHDQDARGDPHRYRDC